MGRRSGPVLTLLVVASLALAVGCSNEASPASPNAGSAAPSTAPHASVLSGGGTTTVVEPPVTLGGTDPSEAEVFAALELQLPMSSDAERACAADALSRDAELFARVRGGVAPNSEDLRALSAIVAQCRISTTAATQFAQDFAATHPGTSPEQQRCLHDRFGTLTAADIDALLGAALTPTGSTPPPGAEILARLLADCGVQP